ncbi:MAG: GDP-mannose 4,6-dehydratase [Nitrosomonadales bacterium]|nr:GDP-mannose 4,6-dehydratase [Nitrosomonadales bacterium]
MSVITNRRKALICGIGGQDGAYLARLLLGKGYEVWGTSRDAQASSFTNLELLGIKQQLVLVSMASNDFRSVLSTLKHSEPDEVYFLSGQTSVGLSFEQPVETLESITLGTLNLLEAIRFLDRPIKLYHASSSECFGDAGTTASDENTPFHPRSPYAVAKASAHWLVANYREAYGLFACNGILFNHESPLRPPRFVTRKIISAACRIAKGSTEKLALGKLNIVRDWGWAPEYVEAMWRMLQQEKAEDFIIATGEANSLEAFVNCTFDSLGLNWRDHVVLNSELFRPTDLFWSQGNPAKAERLLGWQSASKMKGVIHKMIEGENVK